MLSAEAATSTATATAAAATTAAAGQSYKKGQLDNWAPPAVSTMPFGFGSVQFGLVWFIVPLFMSKLL